MKKIISYVTIILFAFLSSLSASAADRAGMTGAKPTIILVHGSWVDGSSWSQVIPLLQAHGYEVTAAQLPLTSLANDVAVVKRAIGRQSGPVILVGHSYGGAVITEAGNDEKVKGLVYIAAFAPEAGQSINDTTAAFPPAPLSAEIRPDSQGYLFVTLKGIREDITQDLPMGVSKILFATQGPIFFGAFAEKVSTAAWKDKPSRYIVTRNDRALQPALQESFATRIKAKTTRLNSGHAVMFTKSKAVANVIMSAAQDEDLLR